MSNGSNSTTSDEDEAVEDFIISYNYGAYYQIYYPLSIVLWVSGVTLNFLTVLIFTRMERCTSLNFLLSVIAISDTCFLTCRATYSVVYYACSTVNCKVSVSSLIYLYGGYMAEEGSAITSQWVGLVVGTWRFMGITWPLRAKEWFSRRKAKVTVTIIVSSAFLLTVQFPIMFKGRTTQFRGSPVTILVPNYSVNVNRVVMIVLCTVTVTPMALMSVITVALLRNVYCAYRERLNLRSVVAPADDSAKTSRTTLMLAILLLNFILTNIPSMVLYMANYIVNYDIVVYSNVFFMVQQSEKNSTFFIYFLMCQEFRKTFRNIFRKVFS